MKLVTKVSIYLGLMCLVAACGGSGGDGGSSSHGFGNDTPTEISLSSTVISEDAPSGTTIGVLSVTNQDGGPFIFSLLDDEEGRFIVNGAELLVADSTLLDYATASLHSITVEAIDMDENNYSTSFWITVTPKVVLHVGQTITVTTASDAEKCDVSSVDGLVADPGSDGISLREAITASNNTPGPETIFGANIALITL